MSANFSEPQIGDLVEATHNAVGLKKSVPVDIRAVLYGNNAVILPEGTLALVIDAEDPPGGLGEPVEPHRVLYLLVGERLLESLSGYFRVVSKGHLHNEC